MGGYRQGWGLKDEPTHCPAPACKRRGLGCRGPPSTSCQGLPWPSTTGSPMAATGPSQHLPAPPGATPALPGSWGQVTLRQEGARPSHSTLISQEEHGRPVFAQHWPASLPLSMPWPR